MKKTFLSFIVLFLGIINSISAQANKAQTTEVVNFLQGKGVYEDGVMKWFQAMQDYAFAHFAPFIYDAQGLACIFMLIYFSIKSYEMMSGDKQLEIMPLLRPFGLIMIIMWWGVFCKMVKYPTDVVAAKSQAMYDSQKDEINNLRIERASLMIQVADQLVTIQAKTQVAADDAKDTNKGIVKEIVGDVKEFFADNIYNPIVEMKIRMQTSLQLLITQLLETIAMWILRVCVYLIFLLQIFYSTVLVILGPFSVAVSILPAFRDALVTWIARFVSVNLYVGVAWLVLYISSLLQEFALKSEIAKYETLANSTSPDNLEKLSWLASNGILSFGLVIVTFIVSAIAITTVPSISTWIISTSGITSAASTAGRSGSTLSRITTKAFLK